MLDKLIEDIVEVTETLMGADKIDIDAFVNPNAKPTSSERINMKEKWAGWGNWGKEKADEFRAKMKEHTRGHGVFKRGVC